MITTSDITDILYSKCGSFEMDVYRKGCIPDGVVNAERIVILPKDQSSQTYWKKCFVEVNICVPNLAGGMADLSRLQELERMAQSVFDGVTGEYDFNHYLISVDSLSGVNKDEDMKCHYVNVRLLFEVLNC